MIESGSLLPPLSSLPAQVSVVIRRAKGIFVEDTEGKRYIDGMAGVACVNLGYGNEEIAEAARRQMSELSFWHLINGAKHEGPYVLAERLRALSPDIDKVFFCSSGSEANDTQLKILRYVNHRLGRPDKRKVIAHLFSYHGSTAASCAITGNQSLRDGFVEAGRDVVFVRPPSYHYCSRWGQSEQDYVAEALAEIEAVIEREGPETIAAYFAEPCMAAGGMVIPPDGYYEALSGLLARHDIPLIADDVVCGFGRLGAWLGSQKVGMTPWSASVAKGLSSGYAPIGAVLLSEPAARVIEESGSFWHGFTYSGHPLGVAVALKVLEIYERDDVPGHVRRVAPRFAQRLARLAELSPIVGVARSVGLFGAFDILADPARQDQFDASLQVGAAMRGFALAEGVIVRDIGSTIALCPPLVITEEEIDQLFDRIEAALARMLDWLARQKALAA